MSVEEFMRQRAVNIVLDGSYSLGTKWYDPEGRLRTFACRTTRVSPYRMIVDVPVVGKVGDRLTSHFGDFGRLDGTISDAGSGKMLLELEMEHELRERLSNKLTWLEKKQRDPTVADIRQDARVIPANPHSMLTFADGSTQPCLVIDMSSGGVAVSAELQPEIGYPLAVGACVGRVVRLFGSGFAVKFVEPQSRADLERLLLRAAPPLALGEGGSAARDSALRAP